MRTCSKPDARAARAISGKSRRNVTSAPVRVRPFHCRRRALSARMRANCSFDSGRSQSIVPSIMQWVQARLHLKCTVTSTWSLGTNNFAGTVIAGCHDLVKEGEVAAVGYGGNASVRRLAPGDNVKPRIEVEVPPPHIEKAERTQLVRIVYRRTV